MKQSALIFLMLIFISSANAQFMKPVKWEFETKKISSDTYELISMAYIQKPWHLYGQFFEDGGPVKLVFNFEDNDSFELIGKTEESPKPKVVKDEIFNIDVHYFADKAVFTQKVKVRSKSPIKLFIEGQVCNDDTGMCVMVSGEHTFILN